MEEIGSWVYRRDKHQLEAEVSKVPWNLLSTIFVLMISPLNALIEDQIETCTRHDLFPCKLDADASLHRLSENLNSFPFKWRWWKY